MKFWFLLLFFFSGFACAELPILVEKCFGKISDEKVNVVTPEFAEGFRYYQKKELTIVEVQKKFWLLKSSANSINCSGMTSITVPIKKIISFSTTHLSFLKTLQEEKNLIGFSGLELVNNANILSKIKAGKIVELGFPPNEERLVGLGADAIFSFAVQKNDEQEQNRLSNLGLPFIFVSEYKEKTPLARAEWLKFFALFFKKETMAQKIFTEQKIQYFELKKKLSGIKTKPLVITGELRGGIWYAAGGESDLAQLIADSGGEYLWKHKLGRNFITLSFEEVLKSVHTTKDKVIWLPQNTWTSYKEILKSDTHYRFDNFLSKIQVYNNNFKRNAKGYSDYWEDGLAHPDLLIAELGAIFHPRILKSSKQSWFWELK